MGHKLRVYISSTFDDLRDHRAALKLALEKAGHQVTSMETYPAFDQWPLDRCLADVREADVLILLVAHRYGYRPRQGNADGQSITRLEYEQARSQQRPCLVFTVDPDHPWSPKWIDRGEDGNAVEAFRLQLEERHGVNRFTDPEQLSALVLAALSRHETGPTTSTEHWTHTLHNLPAISLDPDDWPGRQEAFEALIRHLASAGPPLVIRGMDGVGKTSLALRLAHHQRQEKACQAICLLEARAGRESMLQQLLAFVVTRLDLSPPEDFEPASAVAWCLDRWPGGPSPVLLLLDDLVDAAVLQSMERGLPERFRLLITTRLRIDGAMREEELLPLQPCDALAVLERRGDRGPFDGGERPVAEAIAGRVGGLPLALTLLARQLRRDPDLPLASLQRRLVDQGALSPLLQGTAPELLVDQGLAAGFKVIWRQLGELEREMALCLGELAPAVVPMDLLRRCVPEGCGEDRWQETRASLQQQSLLERPRPRTYRLHPLLHDLLASEATACDPQERQERLRRLAGATAAWARTVPELPEASQREHWQAAMPHLERAADWPPERFAVADRGGPCLALGRFLASLGQERAALTRLQEACRAADRDAPAGNEIQAGSLELIGGLLRERGQLEEAEDTCRRALSLRELLGSGDLELASALNALALVLHERGTEEAEAMLRRALALRQGQLPPQDSRVITSLNNLAKELARRGKLEEARRLYGQGLEASQGRANLLTVGLHNNLAWLEWQAGRDQEAMAQLAEAVRLAGVVLGLQHPRRGLLLKNLAVLEDGVGENGSAEAHYREALAILDSTWGREDPRSQDCRLTLETFLADTMKAQKGESSPDRSPS